MDRQEQVSLPFQSLQIKRVTFEEVVEVFPIPRIMLRQDKCRFQNRCKGLENLLKPFLLLKINRQELSTRHFVHPRSEETQNGEQDAEAFYEEEAVEEDEEEDEEEDTTEDESEEDSEQMEGIGDKREDSDIDDDDDVVEWIRE